MLYSLSTDMKSSRWLSGYQSLQVNGNFSLSSDGNGKTSLLQDSEFLTCRYYIFSLRKHTFCQGVTGSDGEKDVS